MQTRVFLPEWHPQWGVLLAWPHPDTDWLGKLEPAEICYSAIVKAIAQREHVLLLCRDESHQQHISRCLGPQPTVHYVQVLYNDTWTRDFGFITVLDNHKPLLVNFIFNAWGDKYDGSLDNAVNQHLVNLPLLAHNPVTSPNLVMEGGSLETDGQGTLLTTEICLLNPHRNPHLDKAAIETQLRIQLGVERILWLANGHLEGDDTDAHIDTLARFADPQTIVYMTCDDPSDSHYPALKAMEQELHALTQANGQPYQLLPIPIPAPIYAGDRRLAASYVNFLIINGAVLLPIYADTRTDTIAITQLQAAFPNHTIIPIDCRALIVQNGSLHCITMQIPQEVINA